MSRTYGQFCGLARAAEVVGERWALLILRDLIVGPRRFTDLRRGLPGIPTNILTARLKELEQALVVRRRVLPRPSAAVVYELTAYGRELEEIILHLGLWGSRSLGHPRPGEVVTRDSLIVTLRSAFRPEAARRLNIDFELHVGEIVLHARVHDGVLDADQGPLEHADLVIVTHLALKSLMTGELAPAEAIANQTVRITGRPALLNRFVDIFHIPAPPMPT